MVIVIAIIGVISILAFYGFNNYGRAQAVANAQQEFISNLRSVQNSVNNGADGVSVKWVDVSQGGSSYVINDTHNHQTVVVLNNVTINKSTTIDDICFNNKYLSTYDANNYCGNYLGPSPAVGVYNSSAISTANFPITFTFTWGSYSKNVVIEASGYQITRIYAQ